MTSVRRAVLPVILLLVGLSPICGCGGRVALSEVPILGGTEADQEQVRQTLLLFDQATGPGRLRLTRVAIGPLDDQWAGHSARGRIWLDPDTDLSTTLLHELCHALDDSEELLADPVPLFDDAAALVDAGVYPSDRDRRSEVLAEWCELGPLGADALLTVCPGDDPLAAELSSWVSSRIWQAWEPAPSPAPLGPTHASWRSGSLRWDLFELTPTADPDQLQISLWPSRQTFQVGLDSGEPRPEAPPAEENHGLINGLNDSYGWPGGPGAALVSWSIDLFGGYAAPRLLSFDDPEWAVAPGCLSPWTVHRLFTARDQIWLSSGDGDAVRWTAVGR